jgi:GGDEF domain-containing protein
VQFGLTRAEEANLLAERLRNTIAQPFDVDGHLVGISACVGTVVSNDRGDRLEHLLQHADARLYQAKRARCTPARQVA